MNETKLVITQPGEHIITFRDEKVPAKRDQITVDITGDIGAPIRYIENQNTSINPKD